MSDDLFNGRGARLSFYSVKDEAWPFIWRLPEIDEDGQDLFGKIIYLADDLILRTMVNIWDHTLRLAVPDIIGGIQGGAISAHARFTVALNGPTFDLERAADAVRYSWLGMARQAHAAQLRGSWEGWEGAQDAEGAPASVDTLIPEAVLEACLDAYTEAAKAEAAKSEDPIHRDPPPEWRDMIRPLLAAALHTFAERGMGTK